MSKIEVNTVAPQCGTTLTLGESGDTVTLGTGASQSGFGRTGTVDWQTSIKTSTITAVNGEGYFVNTTAGAITANLPAGSAGSIVAFRDYANTFDTNALTISPNGSENINGDNVDLTVNTEGESLTLVYADATKGWLVVNDGNNDAGSQAEYIVATGGNTISTVCTNFKAHIFTGPGTFTVCSVGNCAGSNKVDYLIVAGGGGGATQHSGGGGGGGFRGSFPSPGGNLGTTPVSAQGYPVVVGGGGARSPTTPNAPYGCNGVNSSWNSIVATGGGAGGGYVNPPGAGTVGKDGGSGGGGGSRNPSSCGSGTAGGSGNTPPQSSPAAPVQGFPGGSGTGHSTGGGGGGGAGGCGGNAGPAPGNAGAGGVGRQNNICGNNYYWAGGGGGASHCNTSGAGGIGGGGGGGTEAGSVGAGGGSAINAGGTGGNTPPASNGTGGNGGDNSGGGGGGAGNNTSNAGNGGSGIVIIRYKFQ